MANTKLPAGKAPPAGPGAKKPVAPPARRLATTPQARRGRGAGDPDRFGLYFIAGATAFILLFGAIVWGLRGINNQSRVELAATATALPPTATLEVPAALVSAVPFATVTASAPDALTGGPFATPAALQSVFTTTIPLDKPPPIPPQIPQPQIAVSADSLDFGPVAATGVVTRALILGNVGARPLQVRALLTDCACLAVTAEAGQLPSGSRTHLVITYDPAADSGTGAQTHHLAILVNDPQTPRQDVAIKVTHP